MSEPMSEARLAEIREYMDICLREHYAMTSDGLLAMELLADDERLRAELAAWARLAGRMEGQRDAALEIVRAVASSYLSQERHNVLEIEDGEAIREQARALLARSTGEGEGSAG